MREPGALTSPTVPRVLPCTRTSTAPALRARTVTVKLRDGDFTTRQAAHTVPDPVETDHAVYLVALPLVRELRRRRRTGVRLLGVALSGLLERDDAAEAEAQLGLFPIEGALESDRDRALARVVDDLRDRFGRGAVMPGRVLEKD